MRVGVGLLITFIPLNAINYTYDFIMCQGFQIRLDLLQQHAS